MTIPANIPMNSSVAVPGSAEGVALDTLDTSSGLLSRAWRWLRSLQVGRVDNRRLRVADTVSLGEKRFVAVVQVDGRHFLLAGGPANIALLAQLNDKDDFGDVLKQTMTVTAPAPAPAPAIAPAPVQQEQKPARRRTARRKKAVAPIAAAPPVRAKAATPAKKVTSAGMKKQPALAAKRSSKPVAPQGRFGDIPPATNGGARAFEKWLGRTLTTAPARTPAAKVAAPQPAQPATESAVAPGPMPMPMPAPTPAKQTLNEWLQEVRPVSEKPMVHSITEPVARPTVEEYA